jgi:p-hydroxybenzoate 3-monooxygenase
MASTHHQTQVAIIGAGPAGMFLGLMLQSVGIGTRVIERRDRDYVEGRVRAGVLEPIAVELMARLGLDARLQRDGMAHDAVKIAYDGGVFGVDFQALVGASVTVYGQQEVMRDLFDAAQARDLTVVFDADAVAIHGHTGNHPQVTWRKDGVDHDLSCDFVIGCDGFHGVSRAVIAAGAAPPAFERAYPFGWLGILADAPPLDLVYCNHERGFALASMRSPTRSRYYIQCGLEERTENWSDERFFDELEVRLGPALADKVVRAPSFEKSIAPLRSFVFETMREGRLFLAGDAAHIVPPTGAKGLNLAVSDVILLAEALEAFYRAGSSDGLEGYAGRALDRIWKAERFSWWFTGLTHRFPETDPFSQRMQRAELDYLRTSTAAQTALAENYIGLPLGGMGGSRWR